MRGTRSWLAGGMLAAGIVVGYLLGGVAPRVQLAERQAEIDSLNERIALDARNARWRSGVPGFDQILQRGVQADPESVPAGPEAGAPDEDGPDVSLADGGLPLSDGGGGVPAQSWRANWGGREHADERVNAFRRAASIQRVRRVQSRAALQQQADLDDDQMARIDRALETMNGELVGYGEELLVLAMGDQAPPARDMLGITHDVTGILHRAQLELEAVVGEERAGHVDPSALEVWNHVDLDPLEPAARALSEAAR